MSEAFEKEEEDFDYSDLEPYEEVAEEENAKADGELVKHEKLLREVAEKQARMEAQLEREKLVNEFYAKASEEAKELADVLLAGVSDPKKVKKLLDLASAKASKLVEPEPEEEADVEKAFAPPPAASAPEVIDKGKETAERTRSGDASAALLEFLASPAQTGPGTK